MACFLVPTAEAIAAAIITKAVEAKAQEPAALKAGGGPEGTGRIPFSRKLRWLTGMLWGGSALLAFEHIWHGEVTLWFPFLTAAGSAEGTGAMLREMSTVGVSMAALVTAVWLCMVAVSNAIEKRAAKAPAAQTAAN